MRITLVRTPGKLELKIEATSREEAEDLAACSEDWIRARVKPGLIQLSASWEIENVISMLAERGYTSTIMQSGNRSTHNVIDLMKCPAEKAG